MRTIKEVVKEIKNIHELETELKGKITPSKIPMLLKEILEIGKSIESVNGDLISRSALIEEIWKRSKDATSEWETAGILNLIHTQTAYNDEWISCSEKLPEESGEYYTYVYYEGHYMYSIDEIDCGGIIKEWNCSSDYQIIAWKQIAPYQPEGE